MPDNDYAITKAGIDTKRTLARTLVRNEVARILGKSRATRTSAEKGFLGLCVLTGVMLAHEFDEE